MALYDMTKVKEGLPVTKESLIKLNRTTFAEENIHERTHLQVALRDHIDLIDGTTACVSAGGAHAGGTGPVRRRRRRR